MKTILALSLASLLTSGLSKPVDKSGPPCKRSTTSTCDELLFPITAQATNLVLPAFPTSTAPGTFFQYLEQVESNEASITQATVSGTWNIAGLFSEPAIPVAGRENTIQVLLHGLAYDKTYWNGENFPNPTFAQEYSWISHANNQGYATLAIDNLGNGNSSHPDPTKYVQSSLQIQVILQIFKLLRSGKLSSCITTSYDKIIFVTHSYGSEIGVSIAGQFPTTGADAYIITGLAFNNTGLMDSIEELNPGAASVAHPSTQGSLPAGYQSFSPAGVRNVVYSFDGEFDPAMATWDSGLVHTFAAGEVLTGPPQLVSSFTGPVMVLDGRQDAISCGNGTVTGSVTENCGIGPDSDPAHLGSLFPQASVFDTYITANTGHVINNHYSAPESFGAAHMFLERVGF